MKIHKKNLIDAVSTFPTSGLLIFVLCVYKHEKKFL